VLSGERWQDKLPCYVTGLADTSDGAPADGPRPCTPLEQQSVPREHRGFSERIALSYADGSDIVRRRRPGRALLRALRWPCRRAPRHAEGCLKKMRSKCVEEVESEIHRAWMALVCGPWPPRVLLKACLWCLRKNGPGVPVLGTETFHTGSPPPFGCDPRAASDDRGFPCEAPSSMTEVTGSSACFGGPRSRHRSRAYGALSVRPDGETGADAGRPTPAAGRLAVIQAPLSSNICSVVRPLSDSPGPLPWNRDRALARLLLASRPRPC
jgi:hypothetical protein